MTGAHVFGRHGVDFGRRHPHIQDDGSGRLRRRTHKWKNAMKRIAQSILMLLVFLAAAGMPAQAQVKDAEKALKKQKYDEALMHLQKALEKKPSDKKALALKVRVYEEHANDTSDLDEHVALLRKMRASYEQALAVKPDFKDVKNRLMLAYINEFQRGIETYNAAQNARDTTGFIKAAHYFEGASIIMPDSSGTYVNQAYAYINAGRSTDAIPAFEGAIEHGDDTVDVYTYLSNLYLKNDRANDAIALLEKGTALHPDNTKLSSQLLNAYALSGNMDQAIGKFQEAVEGNPANKVYRYNLGSLLLQNEQYDAAIEQLKEAVSLDSTYTDAQYNLGAAYVNNAIAVNARMNQLDDDLRAKKADYSAEEQTAKKGEIDQLADQRRALFGEAIAPLEKAKALGEAEGRDVKSICQILFQSYVQTNHTDKAKTVSACAGY